MTMPNGMGVSPEQVASMFERGDAEEVTAEDVLRALCYRAVEDPKTFNADIVKDVVSTLGFGELWETAAEEALMAAAAVAEDVPDDADPDAELGDELGEEEATDPAALGDDAG